MAKGPTRKGFARRPVRRPQPGINWAAVLIAVVLIVVLVLFVWPLVTSKLDDWWTPTVRLGTPTPFLR